MLLTALHVRFIASDVAAISLDCSADSDQQDAPLRHGWIQERGARKGEGWGRKEGGARALVIAFPMNITGSMLLSDWTLA